MWIDIIILSMMAIIGDLVAYFSINQTTEQTTFNEIVYIAPGICFIFLCYVRWGKMGLVTNLAVLLLNTLLYMDQLVVNPAYIVMFIAGYLTWMLALYVRSLLKDGRYSTWYIVPGIFAAIYLAMMTVEWIIGTMFQTSISFESNFLKHLFNIIISGLIVLIMSLQKQLFIDMKFHLENKEEEVSS